ncbi:unnamed protein product [Pseudomonas viridiflava]|uniref:Uncharacterized protein n=1 Tax=Pseudomonas viridiflava TaxID=33069 RepID=A0A1Y6JQ52_PSEVI|nr:unnamed protein product [Pseudomonas viridiflava]
MAAWLPRQSNPQGAGRRWNCALRCGKPIARWSGHQAGRLSVMGCNLDLTEFSAFQRGMRTCPRRQYFKRCILGVCPDVFVDKSTPTFGMHSQRGMRTCPRRRYFKRCILGVCHDVFVDKSTPTFGMHSQRGMRTCPRRRYFKRCILGVCPDVFVDKSTPTFGMRSQRGMRTCPRRRRLQRCISRLPVTGKLPRLIPSSPRRVVCLP